MLSSAMIASWSAPLLSLLRAVAGLLFLEHGTQKLLGFPAGAQAPEEMSLMWFAGVIELVAGTLITLGLFTRPAAFIASGMCAVAYWMIHAPQGPFPIDNGGEAAILFCFIFLFIAAAGPGPWSVDAQIRRGWRSGG